MDGTTPFLSGKGAMRLVVGLGNPGPGYAGHRHNIGFMAVDALARRYHAAPWRRRFQAETAEVVLAGHRALLLKPQTFMNESGRAVGEALRFLKLPLDALVVLYDELDLPPARLRVKKGGGNAGHYGLRSITAHCGNDYLRVRLGIGHPGDKARVQGHVLSDFAKAERPWVEDLLEIVASAFPTLLDGDPARFQSDCLRLMAARGHGTERSAPEGGTG